MNSSLRTIIVDDEPWSLERFKQQCTAMKEINLVGFFSDSYNALSFSKSDPIDLAFLDVDMPKMNGIELARRLREVNPNMIVIFVSAYEEYLPEAMRMKADYYIIKPYKRSDVEDVLYRALLLSRRLQKRIFIRTFGNFEVFVDNELLAFSSNKAKELLALLVDRRGGILTAEAAFNALWEDKFYNNYTGAAYRKALSSLIAFLKKSDAADLIITLPRGHAINTEICDCDLYSYLSGDPKALKMFNGEYMSDYSWGETTLGMLVNASYDVSTE